MQRYAGRWLPVRRWYHAGLVGMCWGFLPCGLIYSSLAWSATAGSAGGSALLMLGFGLGTLPAMVLLSWGFTGLQRWLQGRRLRQLLGVFLIALGVWSAYGLLAHGEHAADSRQSDSSPNSLVEPRHHH